MKNNISKGLLTVGLAALLSTGCNRSDDKAWNVRMSRQHNSRQHNAQYLQDRINQIAVYKRFPNGRDGLSYKSLIEITGMTRELPSPVVDDLPVWVSVIPYQDGVRSKLGQFHNTSDGHNSVLVNIPCEIAHNMNIAGKLEAYVRKELK